MKVLILSSNTGTGHNSVARAIQERFVARGDECIIQDGLKYVSPAASVIISTGHVTLYKHLRKINDLGWRYNIKHRDGVNEDFPLYKLMMYGCKDLALYLIQEKFDIVLCTHVFPGWLLANTVQKYNIAVKTGIVETDYMVTLGSEYCDLDYHFVSAPEIGDALEKLGVDHEKIIVTGIPVKKEIFKKVSHAEAKEQLNINSDRKHIIVMLGSMGGGPMVSITHNLIRNLGSQAYITVICGSNKKMYKDLKLLYGLRKNIRITKFIKEISLWMDSADIFVTKPGGISTTESAIKNLPMVLINSVGGCETENMNFFISRGAAMAADGPHDVAAVVRRLLADDDYCHDIQEALKEIAAFNNTEIICETFGEKNAD